MEGFILRNYIWNLYFPDVEEALEHIRWSISTWGTSEWKTKTRHSSGYTWRTEEKIPVQQDSVEQHGQVTDKLFINPVSACWDGIFYLWTFRWKNKYFSPERLNWMNPLKDYSELIHEIQKHYRQNTSTDGFSTTFAIRIYLRRACLHFRSISCSHEGILFYSRERRTKKISSSNRRMELRSAPRW